MAREQQVSRKQTIAYHARPFVLCGLPLRKPAADQVIYSRRNGNFLLEITATLASSYRWSSPEGFRRG